MLTVACVEWADYCERGGEYVSKLRASVARYLAAPHRFVCLTDDPTRHPGVECQALPRRQKDGLVGWWAKLYLFTRDRFEGRVLYLDLDTIVVGALDALADAKGIVHLKDWGWTKNDYCSAIMAWDAGEHSEIWERYTPQVPFDYRGDQDWITALGGWPALPKGLAVSYRYESKGGPPAGAAVVQCHGKPKPHEMPPEHWAHQHWRV